LSGKLKQSKAEQTLSRILDAALECYSRDGIQGTSLEAVATTAGVGRTTLYRYVDNRDDLLNKVVRRDAEQQREEMIILNRHQDDFAQSVVDSMIHVMRGRRLRPINALLFGSADEALIGRVNLSPSAFYDLTRDLMAPLFERAETANQIRQGVTLELASQWTARLLLSLVNYPEHYLEDEAALREFLQLFLVPSLVKVPTDNS
jgi:AcrR family transcriptional regulator